jgi:hypothetical protein
MGPSKHVVCDAGGQARATLEEFEASISRDTVKHPPPDGTVHPLAAYTLSFLKRLFAYEAAADTLFGDEENEACSHHCSAALPRGPLRFLTRAFPMFGITVVLSGPLSCSSA